MTRFDRFIYRAVERKLPQLTLDLATSFSYRLSAAELVRIRKDSMAWGIPGNDTYQIWEGKEK